MIVENQLLIENIFSAQRLKSKELRKETVGERRKRLKKVKRWILDHREDIRHAMKADLRKSPLETDLSEVFAVLTEVRHALAHLSEWLRPQRVATPLLFAGTGAHIHREPKGVCLIIAPWNYPFLLAVGPLISALAAGNTVILKPSEFTPTVSSLIRQMVSDLFPEDIASVVEGDATVSRELLKLPFDHIFFTGSPEVGKIVMEAASRHLTSVTLELGGKSPTVIDDTADLKDAAEKVAWGKWFNAGQTCVAPDYLLVHERVYDQFLRELIDQAKKRYPKEDYTGIVNQKHFDRLNGYIKDALSHHASLIYGGQGDEGTLMMLPAIFTDVPETTLLMKEEIFGPLLPVSKYSRLEEAVRWINDRPKPLSLYFFSRNKKAQKQMIEETSAGNMVINDCVLQFAHPTLPFGGVNHSGIGKSHGQAGFDAFTNIKPVLRQRTGLTMAKTLYPPYTSVKNKLIDFLVKYF